MSLAQAVTRFKLRRSKSAVAGVRVGVKHIRVVKTEETGSGWEVVATGICPTPPGVFPDGLHAAGLAEALSLAVGEAGAETADAVTVIAGEKVVIRHIRLPVMPEKEVGAAIRWEAERHIPVPVGELVLGHVTLGEVSVDGVKQLNVLVAAAPLKLVHEYCDLFRRAGLKLKAIDLQAIALWRVFAGWRKSANGTVAIVNIGTVSSQFVAVRDGNMQLTRTLMVGGEVSTDTKGEIKNAGREDGAVEMHKAVGGISRDFKTAAGRTGDGVDMVTTALRRRAGEIVAAISQSLDWYHMEIRGQQVERIIITGCGAGLKGLPDLIKAELGLPVDIGFQDLRMRNGAAQGLDPSFAVAFGLALREA
jgi:type IV pilus assembly protein PilM